MDTRVKPAYDDRNKFRRDHPALTTFAGDDVAFDAHTP